MKTTFQLVPVNELSSATRAEMFATLSDHFIGVTPAQFARDLCEKNTALLLHRDDRLVGFSTLVAYTAEFDGEPINVIYSGDTIVTPEAWGTPALPRAWVAAVESLRATLPHARCFWLLLTSGFRTYRFLPVFWREFFPRYDQPTPRDKQTLIESLARDRFGPLYQNGVVRFENPQQLRPSLLTIPEGRERDPHVAFFLSRNPGHIRGDELVALAEISPENLTPAGRRIMRAHATPSLSCE